jgi:hypothetical protein
MSRPIAIIMCIKASVLVLVALAFYLSVLLASGVAANLTSPAIETQEQLEWVIDAEMVRLGFDNDVVVLGQLIGPDEARAIPLAENVYKVKVGGFLANETTVRHELYHICDGHLEASDILAGGFQKGFAYLFWYEPQARIYQITGLRV